MGLGIAGLFGGPCGMALYGLGVGAFATGWYGTKAVLKACGAYRPRHAYCAYPSPGCTPYVGPNGYGLGWRGGYTHQLPYQRTSWGWPPYRYTYMR
jgi:hypothetical protein